MSNVTERLTNLKEQIERGKTEKAKAETNLEHYTKQRDDLVAEMADMGVTPETVDAEIEKLDKEIQESLTKAEELLKN